MTREGQRPEHSPPLLFGTHDTEAIKKLARVLRDAGEGWDVRASAYESILDIVGIPMPQHPTRGISHIAQLIECVDWDLVDRAESGGR